MIEAAFKRFIYGLKLLWKHKFSISDLEQDTYIRAYNVGWEKGKDIGIFTGKNLVYDESIKFYYCDSNGKHYIGKDCDDRYYAEVMFYPSGEIVLSYGMSRYLPWGKTINGYTYPSEPREICFEEYMAWFLDKLRVSTPIDRAVTLS